MNELNTGFVLTPTKFFYHATYISLSLSIYLSKLLAVLAVLTFILLIYYHLCSTTQHASL